VGHGQDYLLRFLGKGELQNETLSESYYQRVPHEKAGGGLYFNELLPEGGRNSMNGKPAYLSFNRGFQGGERDCSWYSRHAETRAEGRGHTKVEDHVLSFRTGKQDVVGGVRILGNSSTSG